MGARPAHTNSGGLALAAYDPVTRQFEEIAVVGVDMRKNALAFGNLVHVAAGSASAINVQHDPCIVDHDDSGVSVAPVQCLVHASLPASGLRLGADPNAAE